MDPAILALAGVSLLAVVISVISVGLVKKYDPNQILYWHLNRKGDVEGHPDENKASILLLSKEYNRYGRGIVQGIMHRGTLKQATDKLEKYLKEERPIMRAMSENFVYNISISALNARLVQINSVEKERAKVLFKEIPERHHDIVHMLQHDLESRNVSSFEIKIKNIVNDGIKDGKTDEEIHHKVRNLGLSI